MSLGGHLFLHNVLCFPDIDQLGMIVKILFEQIYWNRNTNLHFLKSLKKKICGL